MERTAVARRWRSRLVFYLLFVLVSAGVAIAHFSRGGTGMGWAWVVLAAVSAALAVFAWSRSRGRHPVP